MFGFFKNLGFWKNCDGNVLMITGLSILPITVLAGSAIDMANVITDRSRIQHALDIAALDTAKRISDTPSFADDNSAVLDYAAASFHANYFDATRVGASGVRKIDGSVDIDITHQLNRVGGLVREVVLSASAKHKSHFMRLMIGDDPINTGTVSASTVRNDTFDVVMVLDNSGSMSGSRISTLRTAATDLTDILMGMNEDGNPDRVKVGLVPFSAFVNIGAGNANQPWMDTTAVSPIHSENFDQPANRFDLFNELDGVTWQGCVEARPYPHDTKDTLASLAEPATMFVPQFVPDEPDGNNDNGMSYFNNYLDDEGGTCAGRAPAGDDRPAVSQARICKYDDERPGSNVRNSNGVTKGPNYYCKSNPVTPLTTNKTTVQNAITAMNADGTTNIHHGVMWGWRLLSKAPPFTESREDDKVDHYKVIIMMTDGDNFYGYTNNNHNRSRYGAYGYAALNRIEASPLSSGGWLNKSNERTAETCTNAKADAGVLIYSIAFKLSNPTTVDLMRNCATRDDMFFASNSNAELRAAFQEIAESISKLRLTQ